MWFWGEVHMSWFAPMNFEHNVSIYLSKLFYFMKEDKIEKFCGWKGRRMLDGNSAPESGSIREIHFSAPLSSFGNNWISSTHLLHFLTLHFHLTSFQALKSIKSPQFYASQQYKLIFQKSNKMTVIHIGTPSHCPPPLTLTYFLTVLFKFLPRTTTHQKNLFLKEIKTLSTLKCVKQQRLIVGGPSISEPKTVSQGFEFALVSFHENRGALEEYQGSTEHRRWAFSSSLIDGVRGEWGGG